ncbi:MAG: hypothetical protein KBC22_00055 [Candidatus Pacebacteria bacterium]|nr:hypothetical protein [Candidatus Paceibacterota bacterium]
MITLEDILLFTEQFITPQTVWIFAAVIIGIAAIASLVIVWHWTKYGVGFLRKVSMETVYLVITAILVVTFLGAIIRLVSLL